MKNLLYLGTLFAAFAMLTPASPVSAAMAMPVYGVNHETKQCSEFFMGDECMACSLPSGWVEQESYECPAGYSEVAAQADCVAGKSEFCCTASHSGGDGDCADLVTNESEKQCAFVADINECDSLPAGWQPASVIDFWGKACPVDYEWIGTRLDCETKDVVIPPGNNDNPNYSPDEFNIESLAATKQIGKILLQVEKNGEAWYLSPKSKKGYFLGRPAEAYTIMRFEGIGIKTADLNKIPVGLSDLSGDDSDNDGLSDIFEDAIGTDKNKKDTDGDGYDDKAEIMDDFDPTKGNGTKMPIDQTFADGRKGNIFLQVENNGEAWYVNPTDAKRYFLGRPEDAFNVMRELGLGVSEVDFYVIYFGNENKPSACEDAGGKLSKITECDGSQADYCQLNDKIHCYADEVVDGNCDVPFSQELYEQTGDGMQAGPRVLCGDGENPPLCQVGDETGGGIIIECEDTRTPKLIVMKDDVSTGAVWGCNGQEVGANSPDDGATNTEKIVASCAEEDIAAKLCANSTVRGHDDWYLPSKNELRTIYENKEVVSNLLALNYWSSTEETTTSAWSHYFATGLADSYSFWGKDSEAYVRCVRKY